ncbi:MAG: HAD family phosphatase [Actinobacteria bacterium]|nr:HAD family phosphatase [Actinomycetota bacterium]MCL5883157.1 HAD family phosphatase [Actinomycetota bacterium]
MISIEAVIFDLDGVLIDTEQVWDDVRRQFTIDKGGRWRDEATRDMMGMSSFEWSAYMHDRLGLPLEPEEISRGVAARMAGIYRRDLPLIPGAKEAVARMGAEWRLGVASSSNRDLIDQALEAAGLRDRFQAVVSSEEVERGKPDPDVYLEAARRLKVAPANCVAVEDSGNGILAGKAAGMRVVAIPNRTLPPEATALARADLVIDSLAGLTPAAVGLLR